MIEELEAEAVSQMVAVERGSVRLPVTRQHDGALIEVTARRRRDGAGVLRYSYGGVRLERAVLLMLTCPSQLCEKSLKARRLWAARSELPQKLQQTRRTTTLLPLSTSRTVASLFSEITINQRGVVYEARPATFSVMVRCPVGAHAPINSCAQGWDLFSQGSYICGGLAFSEKTRSHTVRFPSIEAIENWIETGV